MFRSKNARLRELDNLMGVCSNAKLSPLMLTGWNSSSTSSSPITIIDFVGRLAPVQFVDSWWTSRSIGRGTALPPLVTSTYGRDVADSSSRKSTWRDPVLGGGFPLVVYFGVDDVSGEDDVITGDDVSKVVTMSHGL